MTAVLIFFDAAVAAFLLPPGLSFSVSVLPAATFVVVVVSLIVFLTPAIFTVPLAVTTIEPLAGAVTFVAIDSAEPATLWVALGPSPALLMRVARVGGYSMGGTATHSHEIA